MRVADRTSVAACARWRAAFVGVFVVLLALRVLLAARLSPFGDEAFYWQESRHPAWGYSDLPPLTAWLIRLGEAMAGHGLLGMRWPFLLLGSVLPWLVAAFARRAFGERAGWQAGLLCLALPLCGSLGVLALPDAPLTVAIMLALYALLRAMAENRRWQWLLLGAALAVCWLTHYRAAMVMLAGLLLCLLTPRGRAQWRRGGLWLALGLAVLGSVPLAVSNWQQRGAGLAFQVIERNPWRFHADALVQPLEQALACTPLLYALLLWALWRCLRRRGEGAPWDLVALVAVTFVLGYFLLGLFADDLRFRAHWPLPGYLPLLAALPPLLHERMASRRWRGLAAAAFVLAALGQLGGLAYLGLAAGADAPGVLAGFKAFPAGFVGWREGAVETARLLGTRPAVLATDNFMLAAELDFAFDGRIPVYALDNPLNTKHGRAPQLAIWQRDEKALRATQAGRPLLLAVDETALRERERAAWLDTLCARIEHPRPLARLDLFGGGKRMAFYAGTVPVAAGTPAADPDCSIQRAAHAASYGG